MHRERSEIERRKASSIKEELEKSKKKRDKLVEDRKKRLAKKVKNPTFIG